MMISVLMTIVTLPLDAIILNILVMITVNAQPNLVMMEHATTKLLNVTTIMHVPMTIATAPVDVIISM
jgi:hypothetical protein